MNPQELAERLRRYADRMELNGGGVTVEAMRQAADLLATDDPTLTIRAVRCPACEGTGNRHGRVSFVPFDPCGACHGRGPEPGWVWPKEATMIFGTATGILNALYAAQSRIG